LRSTAPQGSSTSQELEELKARLATAEELEKLETRLATAQELAQGQEAEPENAQMATAVELEDLCAVTAEGLTDVCTANVSELVTSALAS